MPGGIINTGTHPKLLWPGIHAIWGQAYAQHETEYTQLYEVNDSGKAWEEDVQVTGFGLAPIKTEGGPMAYDSEVQGMISRYVHVPYALGYKVTFEERRDNLYEEVSSRRAKANAFSIAQTIENVSAFLYNNAFSSSFFTTGDGVALISAAHVQATGGTFSNALTPGASLTETALEDMCTQLMGMQTDRGLMINIMPRSLHIHRSNYFNAQRILKSSLQSDTANNAINVLKATNAFPGGAQLNHYFTNPGAWFIRTNCPQGMQFFWRDRPIFDQDNEFDTKNACAATYMRFSVGATDPRGIVGSNGP
jgi:hypothetical protein